MGVTTITGFTAITVGREVGFLQGSGELANIVITESSGRQAHVWLAEAASPPWRSSAVGRTAAGEWSIFGPSKTTVDQSFAHAGRQLFGVAASWPVAGGAGGQFYEAAITNAVASVEAEAGCGLFGVVSSDSDEDRFSLVEIFESEDSFRAHLDTPHFRRFAEAAQPIYVGNRADTVKGNVTWKR